MSSVSVFRFKDKFCIRILSSVTAYVYTSLVLKLAEPLQQNLFCTFGQFLWSVTTDRQTDRHNGFNLLAVNSSWFDGQRCGVLYILSRIWVLHTSNACQNLFFTLIAHVCIFWCTNDKKMKQKLVLWSKFPKSGSTKMPI